MIKNCFAEKTKSIILQKSGGAMAPLAPPVSTALSSGLVVIKNVNSRKTSKKRGCFRMCNCLKIFQAINVNVYNLIL